MRWPVRPPLGVLFFLSGISGLIYQVVWLRVLTRLLGSTVYASSTVLASFMAGLALGSYVAGRLVDRTRSPLRVYGILEIAIAACGMALLYVFDGLLPAYRFLYSALEHSPTLFLAARAGVVFTLLLIPTALMGATLPVLSSFVTRASGDYQKPVARLYGLNTLGAMAGSLASGLVLLGLCGETWTVTIAAAINAGVGLLALKQWPSPERVHADATDTTQTVDHGRVGGVCEQPISNAVRRLVLVSFAISGFTGLGFEVIWTRQLQLFMGTSIYAFSAMLVLYLAGLALGSLLVGESEDGPQAQCVLGGLQCILGAVGLVSQCWLAFTPPGDPFEMSGLLNSLGPGLAVFLFALVSGMMFPRALGCFGQGSRRNGQSVGTLYAANTLGCIMGSLATGFLLIPALGSGRTATILSSVNLAVGLTIWGLARPAARFAVARFAVPGVALLATVLIPAAGHGYDAALLRSAAAHLGDSADLCFHREGAVAATTAFHNKSDHRKSTLWVNGVGMTHLGTVTKLMAHLPLMLHGDPHRILVVCFGMGTTVRSAATHANVDITSVELVPEVYDCFGYFHSDGPELWHRPNIHAVVADGRNFLLLNEEQYDVITIDPPPPVHSAGTVNLYTREFFELCRRRLRPDGIACLWIPPVAKSELLFIMASFGAVFPHTTVWTAPDYAGMYCIGQVTPRDMDVESVNTILSRPETQQDLTEYGFQCADASDLMRLRVLDAAQFRGLIQSYPVMTDDRPYTEFPLWRRIFDREESSSFTSDDLRRVSMIAPPQSSEFVE